MSNWSWAITDKFESGSLRLPSGVTARLAVERLPHWPDPNRSVFTYGSPEATCFDMVAAFAASPDKSRALWPGRIIKVPLGFRIIDMSIVDDDGDPVPGIGLDFQLRARSGLAAAHGVTLVNSIGTIDADYRNEVAVLLTRFVADAQTVPPHTPTQPHVFQIRHGDRVAQATIGMVLRPGDFSNAEARNGGFGSTGVR